MVKSQKKILLAIIIGLAVVISASLFFVFVGNTKDVLVATKNVTANKEITADMFTTERVDAASLPDDYISASDAKDIVGYYTYIGFTKGSVLTKNNIATGEKKASSAISKNKTLLTINATNLPSGIQSGDHVNIIIGASVDEGGKVAITYQNIEVSNIYVDEDNEVNGLEVSVTPEQAQKIVYAQINGQLSVALLPIDYKEKTLEPTNESGFLDTTSASTSSSETSANQEETSNEIITE